MPRTTAQHHTTSVPFQDRWLVTTAASWLGLVFGILYVWSVIKGGIPGHWGWSHADKALPYSVMAVTFSFVMVPAGMLQDRIGPRPVVILGGFLTGLGCMIAGYGGSLLSAYILGFGIITGAGVGFGYSALTPAAVKWFPPQKTGMITGIVVAGAGLAPVPLAPLTHWLLIRFSGPGPDGGVDMGVSATMICLGAGIWGACLLLTRFIKNPPESRTEDSANILPAPANFSPREMVGSTQFRLLFPMYFSGASAGLVFISTAADLGRQSLGGWAFLAVVVLALGNTAGRILAGLVSDRIGRQLTLCYQFIGQAMAIYLLLRLSRGQGAAWNAVLPVVFIIGMNYGANLTVFPAICKDFFGIKNFGLNYGCLFTAFGTAGLIMPWLNGIIRDLTGRTDLTYFIMIAMLLTSAVLALLSRWAGPPHHYSHKGIPVR